MLLAYNSKNRIQRPQCIKYYRKNIYFIIETVFGDNFINNMAWSRNIRNTI